MKTWIIIVLILGAKHNDSFAETKIGSKAVKKSQMNSPSQGTLSTNLRFKDHQVNGTRPSATDAIAEIEDDKKLKELLGFRKHFDDRLERSQSLR
jgi:hypothetical protein